MTNIQTFAYPDVMIICLASTWQRIATVMMSPIVVVVQVGVNGTRQ